jgi:hypothetical protein
VSKILISTSVVNYRDATNSLVSNLLTHAFPARKNYEIQNIF